MKSKTDSENKSYTQFLLKFFTSLRAASTEKGEVERFRRLEIPIRFTKWVSVIPQLLPIELCPFPVPGKVWGDRDTDNRLAGKSTSVD